MSSAATRPLLRFSSLVRRKDRQGQYQTWQDDMEEEDEDLSDASSSARTRLNPSPCDSRANPVVEFPSLAANSPEPLTGTENKALCYGRKDKLVADELLECFYIGSYDMTGLAIRGRGCINLPASIIWQQSQDQDRKPRRVGSWSGRQHYSSTLQRNGSNSGVKPRYVRLVTGSDAIHILDQRTDEVIMMFAYSKIPFVGTHPKYTRLFAFTAETQTCKTPFCHAFKCEDTASAKTAACMLSDVFQKKIQELVRKAAKKETCSKSPS